VTRLRLQTGGLPSYWEEPTETGEAIAQALQWLPILSSWEQDFIRSIANRRHLSEKQMNALARVVVRIKRHAFAHGLAA
jgi:hypothetical protein